MTGTLLDTIVYAFRDLFGSQNFALFYAYIWGRALVRKPAHGQWDLPGRSADGSLLVPG